MWCFYHVISVYAQLDIQDEVERLHLELQDTLAMYNQACEDLTHARNKVKLFRLYLKSYGNHEVLVLHTGNNKYMLLIRIRISIIYLSSMSVLIALQH